MIFLLQDNDNSFPDPALAEEDGLLAIGGDLSAERLLVAYQNGIFPWYSDDTPIMWYSPHERFVLFPDRLKLSKSMKQIVRSGKFTVTMNKDFTQVIQSCASALRKDQPGTWITSGMQQAYINLHKLGRAHSIEVWQDKALVGGLYGVSVGLIFCGESMFSNVSNASKTALIWLCQNGNYSMIDCQVHTEHLESMGAEFISRQEYIGMLSRI